MLSTAARGAVIVTGYPCTWLLFVAECAIKVTAEPSSYRQCRYFSNYLISNRQNAGRLARRSRIYVTERSEICRSYSVLAYLDSRSKLGSKSREKLG